MSYDRSPVEIEVVRLGSEFAILQWQFEESERLEIELHFAALTLKYLGTVDAVCEEWLETGQVILHIHCSETDKVNSLASDFADLLSGINFADRLPIYWRFAEIALGFLAQLDSI